ncbi:signal peptidase I [bacterium]|nr:signal peptidase I [bacterium]
MSDSMFEVSSSSDQSSESWGSFLAYLFLAGAIALIVRTFIIAPYIVVGASMEPTFDNYHYLLIDKVSYRFSEPTRGDVIVLDLPQNESRALIKRLVGLPGDTITVRDNKVTVTTPGSEPKTLSEPYLDANNYGGPTDQEIQLRNGEYFVLGDNRHVSSDSRTWGVLPRADIVGKVLVRLYPLTLIDFLPGEARY